MQTPFAVWFWNFPASQGRQAAEPSEEASPTSQVATHATTRPVSPENLPAPHGKQAEPLVGPYLPAGHEMQDAPSEKVPEGHREQLDELGGLTFPTAHRPDTAVKPVPVQ